MAALTQTIMTWPLGRSRSYGVTRDSEKGHQQGGRKLYSGHGLTVLLQGQAMLCPLPNELASTQGAQLYTGLCTPGLRTSNTKAVVRSILIRNYGNSPPPITKIAK